VGESHTEATMSAAEFAALRVHAGPDGARAPKLERLGADDLPDEPVEVRVLYSSLNYKDALILSGRGGDLPRLPHVAGIDLAGVVERSHAPGFRPGDRVVATGRLVGERHWGGFTERTRLPADRLLALPAGLSARDAMIFGTAGLTAMLALIDIEGAGVTPERGPILVTGAGGGIGSLAVALLARLGWSVAALEKRDEAGFLKGLGAERVLSPRDLERVAAKPLGGAEWAAAIDTVGGEALAAVLRSTRYEACIAACGMVAGFDVPMTLHPFFARAIRLVGVDSVHCSDARRAEAWRRLAELAPSLDLGALAREIGLADIAAEYPAFLSGAVRGRIVVRVSGEGAG